MTPQRIRVACPCGSTYVLPTTAIGRALVCRCGTTSTVRRGATSRRRAGALGRAHPAVLGAVAIGLLVATGGITLGLTADRKSPLDFVPAGVDAVGRISIRESIEALGLADELRRRADPVDLGFDPTRDVEAVWFAARLPRDDSLPSGLVLVEGTFDPARIIRVDAPAPIERARSGATTRTAVHRGTIYAVIRPADEKLPSIAIACLLEGLIAIGTEEMVERAIDAGQGRAPSVLEEPGLSEVLGKVRPGSLAWAAVRSPGRVPAPLEGLRFALAEAQVSGRSVSLRATARFDGADQAERVLPLLQTPLELLDGAAAEGIVLARSARALGPEVELDVRLDAERIRAALAHRDQ